MVRARSIAFVATIFILGFVGGVLARGRVDPALYHGRSKREAARALLELSTRQAGKGSWENLAVARGYYLGGMKSDGQVIIDSLIAKKAVGSDWMRIGEIYYEGGEWQKAKDAFDNAMNLEPKNASFRSEAGAFYNLKGDRQKAELLFDRAFELESDEVWRTVDIAGSYLGVEPHRQ